MEKSFGIIQLDETSWVILEFTDEDDSFRVISYHESETEAQNALGELNMTNIDNAISIETYDAYINNFYEEVKETNLNELDFRLSYEKKYNKWNIHYKDAIVFVVNTLEEAQHQLIAFQYIATDAMSEGLLIAVNTPDFATQLLQEKSKLDKQVK